MDTLIEIIKLLLVGLIAGLFSAYISTWRHRNEKWWELRTSAYTSVIEALSDLNYYYERNYNALIKNREISDEQEKEIDKFWDSGYHKVRKLADTGVFLFSDEVNNALQTFIGLKNQEFEDYFLYLDSYYAGAQKCLKTVVASAKYDLKVGSKWL